MKRSGPSRPIVRRTRFRPVSSSSEDSDDQEVTRGKDLLIAKQLAKFKTKKSAKRLRKRHLDESKKKATTCKKKLGKVVPSIVRLSDNSEDYDLEPLFEPVTEEVSTGKTDGVDNNNNNSNHNNNNKSGAEQATDKQEANRSISTETAPSEEDLGMNYRTFLFVIVMISLLSGNDPVALALACADVCLSDYTPAATKASDNTPYKGRKLSKNFPVRNYTHSQQHHSLSLLIANTISDSGSSSDHEADNQEQSSRSRSANRAISPTTSSMIFVMFSLVHPHLNDLFCMFFMIAFHNDMPGPKNITREERKGRKQEEEDTG